MKKTTLALGSLLALGLVANTFAETTNVYSRNAVGYVNVNLSTSYSMMSAQFMNSSGQPLTIAQVFPSPADSTIIYIYNTNSLRYNEYFFDASLGWLDELGGDGSTAQLSRGIGFWVYAPSPTNQSLVGEVPGTTMAPTTIVALADGYTLISYPYPTPRLLSQTTLGQTPNDTDTIFMWTGNAYEEYAYFDGLGWRDKNNLVADPVIQPGAAFWYYNASAAKKVTETKPYNWP